MKNLSREEKEKIYKVKMTELQVRWGNPIDDDWNFSDWTDEQLESGLEDTIGQLRFEKGVSFIKTIISFIFWGFIILGIIGLLVFGIKQLL